MSDRKTHEDKAREAYTGLVDGPGFRAAVVDFLCG